MKQIFTFLLSLIILLSLSFQSQNLQAQCAPGTDLVSGVQLTTDGCGTVPTGVTSITIETRGGDGADAANGTSGGEGTTMVGTFPVTPGDELVYLVGVSPTNGSTGNGGGGGGGTAVINRTTSELLVVAAGGGGAANSITGLGGRANTNSIAGGGAGDDANAGGGGFGVGNDGGDGTTFGDATGGDAFLITSLTSAAGGTSSGNANGGAGAGGGGAVFGFSNGGGGGGGHLGGDAGDHSSNQPGQGGDSFVNTGIGGSVDSATAGGDGDGTGTSGHVTFTFGGGSPDVPTLSEWGLIVLALLLMICGTLYLIRQYQRDREMG